MSRQFRIRGMDCAEEVAILKREIGPLAAGEERLSFDIMKARMTVSASPE
jgi:Cd2+/Zn2+-exporting ATPase